MRTRTLIILCLLLTVFLVLFAPLVKKRLPVSEDVERGVTTPRPSTPLTSIERRMMPERNLEEQESLNGLFSLVADYEWNFKQEAERKKSLPFKLLGLGTESARVVDATGMLLIGSTGTNEIYDLEVSPDMTRFVVALGDGNSRVFDSQSGQFIDLPASPDIPNMVGFGSWMWLSDDLLITTSGVQALDATGKPVNCCGGHNVERTQMFAYQVSTRTVVRVSKPESINASVFKINRVSSDGHVEIVTDETHVASGQAGWYRIEVK